MAYFERLKKIRQDFESGDTPPEVIATLNANVDRLLAENAAQKALQVGDVGPLTSQVHFDTGTTTLQELHQDKYLVLTWFRGNW